MRNNLPGTFFSKYRGIAFHLIRHTVATMGIKGYKVDPVFYPVLVDIFNDKSQAQLVSKFAKFFELNKVDKKN